MAILVGASDSDPIPFALRWLGWQCICIPLSGLGKVVAGLNEAGALIRTNTRKDPLKQIEVGLDGRTVRLANLDFLGICLADGCAGGRVVELAKSCSDTIVHASELRIPALLMMNGVVRRIIQKSLDVSAGQDMYRFVVSLCS